MPTEIDNFTARIRGFQRLTSVLPQESMATHHNTVPDTVPDRSEIRTLLEDILRSVPFRTSPQCRNLFRYIVEHSLSGLDDSLRERVIGIEVFGRTTDYDNAEDPVVRLRAADIRKRLAQYYLANESVPGDWRIEIPTGSYKAYFHRVEPHPAYTVDGIEQPRLAAVVNESEIVSRKTSARRRKLQWMVLLFATVVVVAIATLVITRTTRTVSTPQSAFDLFWEPVLLNSRPVLVCTGTNRVYRLSEDAQARYRKNHPAPEGVSPNLETYVPRADFKFTVEDFVPVTDTYLTTGDASAAAQIATLLVSRHHALDLRFGSDFSFGDLREGSAVLVGAFNNSWTLNMTDNLRFVFDSGNTAQMHVQDRFDLSRSWGPKYSNGKLVEDYAIVSRILNSKTGSVLVTIGGLDYSGTQAASNFVTNPQFIAGFAKQAPKDWSRKNLQVVLHTNVTEGIPDSPTVVAAHFW